MGGVKAHLKTYLTPQQVARTKRLAAPALRWNLTLLGRWYGTNKAYDHQRYTPLYERHLAQYRRKPVRLLEIGIGGYGAGLQAGGSSLRMWRSWMPKAEVTGIDLDPRDFAEPRVTTVVGDQADPEFLRCLFDNAGPFDIVIDDGSHVSEHIIISFTTLFPLMRSGSLYVIEDLQTSYDSDFGGGPPGTPGTSVEMLKALVDEPTLGGNVAALHLYPRIAFVERR